MTVTMGSLFSGGGGWEVAGLALGIEPVFGVELDARIAAHYRSVFGDHVYAGSVFNAPWRSFPRPTFLVSSPPCQPSSASGKRARTLRAARGVRVDDSAEGSLCDPNAGMATVDAARELRPPVVLVENSANYAKEPVAKRLVRGLEVLGYTVDVHIFDAADYGCPSSRRRTIVRAVRGLLPPLPSPSPRVGWYEAIADLIPTLPPLSLAGWQMRAMRDVPPPPGEPVLVVGGNPSTRNGKRLVWRAAWQPAPALQKAHNTSGTRVLDADGSVYALSAEALARLLGFPAWYPLPAGRSAAINLIGNSVSPPFIERLLASFL